MKILRFIQLCAGVLISRRAFLIFSILFILFNITGTFFLDTRGGSDLWEHLASMNSFARNPLNPDNPYLNTDDPTHLFTPWHFFWGIIARILGLHPFRLFPLISGIHIFLFLAGIYAFCRNVIGDARYAAALALAMLFFWNRPPDWSGFYNFGLLPITSVFPSWSAFSASLILISIYGKSKHFLIDLVCGISAGFIFLIHPLSGSFLLLGLALIAVLSVSTPILKRAVLLMLPAVSTVIAVLAWPFFPVLHAITGAGAFAELGFAGDWQLFYKEAIGGILPALLGLPFLISLLYKKRFTFISAGFAAVLMIYVLNYFFMQNSTPARYIIYIAFFGHAGIVLTLKHFEKHPARKYLAAGFTLILLIFAASEFAFSMRHIGPMRDIAFRQPFGTHSNRTAFRQYSNLRTHIKENDVVMAPMETSWEIAGIIPCKVVGVRHSNPFMHDYFDRKAAVEGFFSILTSNEARFRILEEYSAKAVLIPEDYYHIAAELKNDLDTVFKDEYYHLFILD